MNTSKKQYDVIFLKDFANYIDYRERKFGIKLLKELKPYGNGKRIQSMINKLKDNSSYYNNKKTSHQPREFNITISNDEPTSDEFADIKQFMVTED